MTRVNHYMINSNKVSFNDVSDTAWYASAVTFLAARGITSGTTATTFSPDASLTRGQFITMLLRAYSISPDANPTDNFADAGNTYYTGYLTAAKRMGITSGIGDNKFAQIRRLPARKCSPSYTAHLRLQASCRKAVQAKRLPTFRMLRKLPPGQRTP